MISNGISTTRARSALRRMSSAAMKYQKDGNFVRPESAFRNWISRDPNAKFPAEANRYALYFIPGCPWAQRTLIVRQLKGLDAVIDAYQLSNQQGPDGWQFTGAGDGSLDADPLHGFKTLKELYLLADPSYEGRYTVPVLWDKKSDAFVSNESAEIIRMFYEEFDEVLPEDLREVSKKTGDGRDAGLYPEHLRDEINAMNEWVYDTVNNGVYKVGLSKTQEAYDENMEKLFGSLDRLEEHLSHGGSYLFGDHITEADVRLYTTLVRFDVAYHTIFMANIKSIRHDYPRLHLWLRRLYWDRGTAGPARGAFYDTTAPYIRGYAQGYAALRRKVVFDGAGSLIVPAGPRYPIEPLPEQDQ